MLRVLQGAGRALSCRGVALSTSSSLHQPAFPLLVSMADTVVVNYRREEGRFTFSFRLTIPDLKIDKQFNLNRDVKEETAAFIERLGSNIAKANKKSKGEDAAGRLAPEFVVGGERLVQPEVFTLVQDFMFLEDLQLRVDQRTFKVTVNPPLVTELKMSDVIMTGMPIYPHKLELEYADEAEVEWFASEKLEASELTAKGNKKQKLEQQDGLAWRSVGRGRVLTPSLAELHCRLRCEATPRRGGVAGERRAATSSALVTLGPGPTPATARHAWTPAPLPGPRGLRVVSYNILADLYADSDYSRTELFPQCPPYALHIDYRVKLVLQELMGFHADLVCLQEVDQKVFDLHLAPMLASCGLQGRFAKKGGQVTEGLAVFCRTERLAVLEFTSVFLPDALQTEQYAYIWDRVRHNPALVETLTRRTTTLALAVVRVEGTGDLLVIGNTHLYFKPDADHVRLVQAEVCRAELERVRERVVMEHPGTRVSILLCGDFNSTPLYSGHQGGVLQFLTSGHLPEDHPDWRSRAGEEVEGLSLTSSSTFLSGAGTPAFTNYTIGFKECIDYIFLEEGRFKVQQVVPFPSEEELSLHQAIPSIVCPSDHIALVVDVELTTA